MAYSSRYLTYGALSFLCLNELRIFAGFSHPEQVLDPASWLPNRAVLFADVVNALKATRNVRSASSRPRQSLCIKKNDSHGTPTATGYSRPIANS
jgi:hypothetical protein